MSDIVAGQMISSANPCAYVVTATSGFLARTLRGSAEFRIGLCQDCLDRCAFGEWEERPK
jgi:hypothetical protein